MRDSGILRRSARYLALAAMSSGFCFSLIVGTANVASAQNDEMQQIALRLATLLRSARAVVSDSQSLINDPLQGDKGFTGEVVLEAAKHHFKMVTQIDLDHIDPTTLEGELLQAEMEAIVEIVDEAQERINRYGVGFKGFLPAIFAGYVAERFGQKMGAKAEIKLTAPSDYVRNKNNMPDNWEHRVIEQRLRAPDHPLGQPVDAMAAKNGKKAYRLILPEYYKLSCLACHGEPKGRRDITGRKKEGGTIGSLGGAISVVIYR